MKEKEDCINQKKVLGLLFALIATVFMFILVVSALPSDVYETPGIINGGIYTITNTRSGKNLDIYNNGRFDNTSVIQFKANSTKNNLIIMATDCIRLPQ